MSNRINFLTKFTVILVLFCTFSSLEGQKNVVTKELAKVGSHSILLNDFLNRYEDYLFSTGQKDNILIRRSILNNMISELLLYHYDDNSKIFGNDEYKKELEWAKKQTILAFLKDREIYAKISISEKELRDAFSKSNEQIAARHLFAETEEEAQSLCQLLQAGADFNILAREIFTDSVLSNNGGYLGYFTWGDMEPEFEDAAYSLNVGEISKPVKTRYGYSIIKLEDRKARPIITEDEFLRKKNHMRNVLAIRKKKPAEIEFMNKLFDPNKLWIDEKLLGNIYNYLAYSTSGSGEYGATRPDKSPLVKYGDKVYSQEEIVNRINWIPQFHREKIISIDALKAVIKGIVIQGLLMDMALGKKYDKDPEVLYTIKKYNNKIFLKFKLKEISDKTELPDSVVKNFYEANKEYFKTPRKINVQEILTQSRETADSLKREIEKGKNFGDLAAANSIREWSAKNKGVIGLSELDKFGTLKDTLWNANLNEVIGPLQIRDLFGLFIVLEKRDKEQVPLESIREEIIDLLKQQKANQFLRSYSEKLWSKVKITIDETLLSSAEINLN